MDQVKTAISNLSIGDPAFHGGLSVFPLTAKERPSLDYQLLADGLKEGLVSVREVSQGGSVPDLAVENRADRPVLIVDGEELVGAKQNRVANLTLLVAAGKTTIIPVSCVEAGRWSYDRPDFAVSERMHYASGRGRTQPERAGIDAHDGHAALGSGSGLGFHPRDGRGDVRALCDRCDERDLRPPPEDAGGLRAGRGPRSGPGRRHLRRGRSGASASTYSTGRGRSPRSSPSSSAATRSMR